MTIPIPAMKCSAFDDQSPLKGQTDIGDYFAFEENKQDHKLDNLS